MQVNLRIWMVFRVLAVLRKINLNVIVVHIIISCVFILAGNIYLPAT